MEVFVSTGRHLYGDMALVTSAWNIMSGEPGPRDWLARDRYERDADGSG
jgi:hypothetical protein